MVDTGGVVSKKKIFLFSSGIKVSGVADAVSKSGVFVVLTTDFHSVEREVPATDTGTEET